MSFPQPLSAASFAAAMNAKKQRSKQSIEYSKLFKDNEDFISKGGRGVVITAHLFQQHKHDLTPMEHKARTQEKSRLRRLLARRIRKWNTERQAAIDKARANRCPYYKLGDHLFRVLKSKDELREELRMPHTAALRASGQDRAPVGWVSEPAYLAEKMGFRLWIEKSLFRLNSAYGFDEVNYPNEPPNSKEITPQDRSLCHLSSVFTHSLALAGSTGRLWSGLRLDTRNAWPLSSTGRAQGVRVIRSWGVHPGHSSVIETTPTITHRQPNTSRQTNDNKTNTNFRSWLNGTPQLPASFFPT
jgi:hypothetical protein